jgi:hypothetical protein
MSVEDMPDERLVRYYENVRQRVEADRAGNHKFMMTRTRSLATTTILLPSTTVQTVRRMRDISENVLLDHPTACSSRHGTIH